MSRKFTASLNYTLIYNKVPLASILFTCISLCICLYFHALSTPRISEGIYVDFFVHFNNRNTYLVIATPPETRGVIKDLVTL